MSLLERPCQQCGECCTYMELPVAADTMEYYRWLTYHGGTIVFSHNLMCVRLEIPCQHLKDGKCAIYDRRPELCREFRCQRTDR